jgi:hypothetical protein
MIGNPDDTRGGETPVEWSAAERAALERLARGAPPQDLEESIVSALRKERAVPAHRRWGWAGLALAASLAAFFAGISVSERGAGRAGGDPSGPPPAVASPGRYMLLLYEDEAYQTPTTPAEGEERAAEYGAWAAGVHARGIAIEGEELAPAAESRTLDGRAGEVVDTAGAPASAAGVVAGYFVIEAPDAAAAAAIARTMPHLEYGGTIVVRKVESH